MGSNAIGTARFTQAARRRPPVGAGKTPKAVSVTALAPVKTVAVAAGLCVNKDRLIQSKRKHRNIG